MNHDARRRVLLTFGTRPEAIKMSPVIREMTARDFEFEPIVCVTGQHRQLLDSALDLLAITPDFDLNLMQPGQDPTAVTAAVLTGVSSVIERVKPDAVLVQGDTSSTVGSALAGFYQGVPVGHVEAGLRSGDLAGPFPEEANRRLADVVARWHFAPTAIAAERLMSEGHDPATVHVTGNTVVDALRELEASESSDSRASGVGRPTSERLILVTSHRREHLGAPLRRICSAVAAIAERAPDARVKYVLHPNPGVYDTVHAVLGRRDRVELLEPLEYPAFIRLLRASYVVLTDSGGVLEEAVALGRPVLVMRETTERPEALTSGVARLVGTDTAQIVEESLHLLRDSGAHDAMSRLSSVFGDGHASRRICDILAREITPRADARVR